MIVAATTIPARCIIVCVSIKPPRKHQRDICSLRAFPRNKDLRIDIHRVVSLLEFQPAKRYADRFRHFHLLFPAVRSGLFHGSPSFSSTSAHKPNSQQAPVPGFDNHHPGRGGRSPSQEPAHTHACASVGAWTVLFLFAGTPTHLLKVGLSGALDLPTGRNMSLMSNAFQHGDRAGQHEVMGH